MIFGEGQELIQFIVATVRFDMHLYLDLLIADRHGVIERLQDLCVEEAKRLLEASAMPVDEISFDLGYEDASFFRRLFKRRTGLTPSQYRRMFKPILTASAHWKKRSMRAG